MDTETQDELLTLTVLGAAAYFLWKKFRPISANVGHPGESPLQRAWDAITGAGPAVASAVQGAVRAGDTSAIAQGVTISTTGGDPRLQGTWYIDPLDVPNPAVQQAWLRFVAQMQAVAAAAPKNDPSLSYGKTVLAAVRQYGGIFLSAASAAGYTVGSLGAAASSSAGIGGLVGGGLAGVLAVDAGLLAYGVSSLVSSFGNGYAQSPADYLLAQQTASALLTGDKTLAQAAQAIANGTATPGQKAYAAAHTLTAAQMQSLTTSAILASGTGSKQLWDPSAPGGYIEVGGQYGVKQAQTAAQNAQEAAAQQAAFEQAINNPLGAGNR